MPTQIFVSHITEEAAIAAQLKQKMTDDFLGQLTVFLSSDTESIAAGEVWFSSLSAALHNSSIFIVLCSPAAITRPWINFEAGAAWIRDIPVIPLCFGGLLPRDLPMPLAARQGLELCSAEGLRRLYARIAQALNFRLPPSAYDVIAAEFTALVERPSGHAGAAKTGTEKAIRSRLDEALSSPRFKWRSLDMLAAAAGVSVDSARAILQADERVRFSRGKSGSIIVGLRSRVG